MDRRDTLALYDFAHVLAIMRSRTFAVADSDDSVERVIEGYKTLRKHADALAADLKAQGWPVD